MSINKFGIQLVKGDTKRDAQSNYKNYIRENCLYKNGEVFDAKSCKIIHLASPETDNDAVNKLHLDHRFTIISDDMENFKRGVYSTLHNLENWKKDISAFIKIKFPMLEKQISDLRGLFSEAIPKINRKIATNNEQLMNEMKQMIDREIKDLHTILKNNIIEFREIMNKELKEIRDEFREKSARE